MRASSIPNAMSAACFRVAMASVAAAAMGWATHIGPNINNPAITSNVNFQGIPGQNWSPAPQDITADPAAGVWLKNLIGFDNTVGNPIPDGVGASLKERANLGEQGDPGPNWFMWTEQILSPDWAWLNGGAQTFPNGPNVNGVTSNNNKTITFTFPSTAAGAGNFLVTEKVIQCVNPNGCAVPTANNPIKVAEFPTQVPEPATCALIALVLVSMVCTDRKRSRAQGQSTRPLDLRVP